MKSSLLTNFEQGTVDDTPISSDFTYVLVGKTGQGKSTIINSLIGEERFITSQRLISCTQIAQWVRAPFDGHPGKSVLHVQVPGFSDTGKSEKYILSQLLEMVKLLKQGVNCIVFAISIQEPRFDKSIQIGLKHLGELFGQEIYKHCKIMFTRLDELTQKAQEKKLKTWTQDIGEELAKLKIDISEPYFKFDMEQQDCGLGEFKRYVLNSEAKFLSTNMEFFANNYVKYSDPYEMMELAKQMDQITKEKQHSDQEKAQIMIKNQALENKVAETEEKYEEVKKEKQRWQQEHTEELKKLREQLKSKEKGSLTASYVEMGITAIPALMHAIAYCVKVHRMKK